MKNKIQPRVLRRLVHFNILAFLGVYLQAAPLSAQSRPDNVSGASAKITFADGNSIRVRSNKEKFRPVGILAGETVNVQLKLPRRFVNTLVVAQAMDGGIVTEDVVIASDGTTPIDFQAGAQPGLYRILLSARGRSALLQFQVPNPQTN